MDRPRDKAFEASGQASPGTALSRSAARLREAGIEDARSEAWLLLARATGRQRTELVTGGVHALGLEEEALLERLVRRRLVREPMAYILGEKEFWSLPFVVGPAVLVPRPDSETVVEAALAVIEDHSAPLRLLDLGTGSGCLLMALLSELPAATGLGIDSSEPALAIARANAARLGLADRATFRSGHWGRGLSGPFDLIVCNPPYIRAADWPRLQPEIRHFEPRDALLAGPDGLAAYRALAPDLARLLAPDGGACLEIGAGQGDAVAAIVEAEGLAIIGRRQDLSGTERCLVARSGA